MNQETEPTGDEQTAEELEDLNAGATGPQDEEEELGDAIPGPPA